MLFCPEKRLIAVAMPSTGSTFVADCLRLLCGAEYREGGDVDQHRPVHLLANVEREGQTVIGTIRDPRTWYPSVYAHAMRAQVEPYLSDAATVAALEALEVYGGGSTEWADVLYGMTHPWELDHIPRSISVLGASYGGKVGDTVRQGRAGIWAWTATIYYGPAAASSGLTRGEDRRAADALLPQENLTHALAQMLDVPAGLLLTVAKRVKSGHEKPDLTEEQLQWIREADGPFARQFGYEV